jgi:hypothetical protein
MPFLFLGAKIAADTTIRGLFDRQYLIFVNDKTSVSPIQVANALNEAPDLFGEARLPQGAGVLLFDQVVVFQHITGLFIDDGADEMVCRQ